LPPGIVWGNGRIEADEIDISTKFPGRITEMLADEGDMVTAGQVVARMDTRDLEASLRKAEAQILQAQKTLETARADLVQQQSRVILATQQLERAQLLLERGNTTREIADQRRADYAAAAAALNAMQGRIGQAEHALEAANQDASLIRINIADNTLIAPRDGRIEYRLANIGEVLGAGGKVFTMLDVANVYMDVFLPTAEAGRAVIGTDGRIVLDALPDRPIPAKVSFVSPQAQFTPKAVETRSERDKLMFRVKVRIDADLLRAHAAKVRTGLPGVAYLRLDPASVWPAQLQPK
jgi:HlyD family secretion protein